MFNESNTDFIHYRGKFDLQTKNDLDYSLIV